MNMNHDIPKRINWEPTYARCEYCEKTHPTISLCPKIAAERLEEALALPYYLLGEEHPRYIYHLKKQAGA
jgi:hypothetical protein